MYTDTYTYTYLYNSLQWTIPNDTVISWDLMGLFTMQLPTTTITKCTPDTVRGVEHVHANILDKACIRRENGIQWDLAGFGFHGPKGIYWDM